MMEPTQKSYLPVEPYRGIDSFRYADRAIFSERDEETTQLYNLINVYRGCLLYGKSGIGKSSLIAAGLIPLLEEYYQPEIIRVYPSEGGTFIVSKILIADDNEANESTKFEPKNYKSSIFDPDNKYENKITLSFSEFENVIKQQTADLNTPVLIFDQFEELITLFEETNQTGLEENLTNSNRLALQDNIFKLLQRIYFNSRLSVKIVLVFREDYLAKFDKLFDGIPDISNFFLRVTALPKNRLKNIISYPFFQDPDGLVYKAPFSPSAQTSLITKLSKHFGEDDLVLTDVQIVCHFLYKCATIDRERHLKEENAISKILELFYRDILDRFDELEKPVAIAILFILVLNERTRNIFHHDLIVAEYLKAINKEAPGVSEPYTKTCEDVLLNLENKARIIRKEERKGGYYYEISSEAIIPYINQLKVTKEKDDLIKEKDIEAKIERKKRRRELFYILGIIVLAIAGVSLYIFQQHQTQQNQEKITRQQLQAKITQQELQVKIAKQQLQDKIAKQQLQDRIAKQGVAQQQLQAKIAEQQLQAQIAQQHLQGQIAEQQLQTKIAQQGITAQQLQAKLDKQELLANSSKSLQKQLDSLKALYLSVAFADTSLKVNDSLSKGKFAAAAYDSLPKTLKLNDVFVPKVYTAMVALHQNSLKEVSLYTEPKREGYKNINGIVNFNDKLYFNRPFNAISDISGSTLFTDPNLIHSWISPGGSMLVAVIANKDETKQLIVRELNKDLGTAKSIKIALLKKNEDVLSLIFDTKNNTCVYATRSPAAIYKLNLATLAVPVLIKSLQNDQYLLLADRGGYFTAITNRGNYMAWDNYTSAEPQSMIKNTTQGNAVTAISSGDLNHKTLFAGCENGDIYKIDASNNVRKFYSPTNISTAVTCLSSSLDGKWLAAGFFDGSIKLWRLDAKERVPADIDLDNRHHDGVSALAFNSRDEMVASTDYGYVYHFPLSIDALYKLFPAKGFIHSKLK